MSSRRALVVAVAALLALTGCGSPSPVAVSGPLSEPAPQPQPVREPSPAVSIDSFAPPGWVDLAAVDPTILVEIRYHGPHNFTGRPVAGYLEPVCLLPERTARALARVQDAARRQGYSLKVYDCYRPTRAGADFLAWRDTADEATRAEFYPSLSKADLFRQGYVSGSGRSEHSSGSAVDVTLVRLPVVAQPAYVPGQKLVACTAPVGQRFADNSVDMGTGYDCFHPLSHTLDRRITGEARANRLLLRSLMAERGFVNYRKEWWHYTLAEPPHPGAFFDFPVARCAVGGRAPC